MAFATREELAEWAENLKHSSLCIIVEGPHDRKAIALVGIPAQQVVTLGRPLYQVAEFVAEKHRRAVILTDLDRKGRELYGKLRKELMQQGVKVDNTYREFLQKKTRLSHIEGINTYFSNMEEEK